MESSKSTLHTLPQDIILNIADHFLDDYLIWKTQFPYLRKLTFKGDTCPYLNLARTHSTLWNMLLARRFAQKALREAEEKLVGGKRVIKRRKLRNAQGEVYYEVNRDWEMAEKKRKLDSLGRLAVLGDY